MMLALAGAACGKAAQQQTDSNPPKDRIPEVPFATKDWSVSTFRQLAGTWHGHTQERDCKGGAKKCGKVTVEQADGANLESPYGVPNKSLVVLQMESHIGTGEDVVYNLFPGEKAFLVLRTESGAPANKWAILRHGGDLEIKEATITRCDETASDPGANDADFIGCHTDKNAGEKKRPVDTATDLAWMGCSQGCCTVGSW